MGRALTDRGKYARRRMRSEARPTSVMYVFPISRLTTAWPTTPDSSNCTQNRISVGKDVRSPRSTSAGRHSVRFNLTWRFPNEIRAVFGLCVSHCPGRCLYFWPLHTTGNGQQTSKESGRSLLQNLLPLICTVCRVPKPQAYGSEGLVRLTMVGASRNSLIWKHAACT
ncbi:hypothetical protein BCR34DRAFT_18967 [Clohesyomyces aquaticus]|uniref:Uncharacterized protein n=1 Tax=Clohesyomyces aquaticus TaxID=1231657 RepID=A0A1Y1ZBN0_9PLEO|nr:hypothetical protein BCR34DRAFT_18967 [Clohesyomyces aquaticus]